VEVDSSYTVIRTFSLANIVFVRTMMENGSNTFYNYSTTLENGALLNVMVNSPYIVPPHLTHHGPLVLHIPHIPHIQHIPHIPHIPHVPNSHMSQTSHMSHTHTSLPVPYTLNLDLTYLYFPLFYASPYFSFRHFFKQLFMLNKY
jgi:hypothetical protein